jgi:REP element-mobilizing transposase RayT
MHRIKEESAAFYHIVSRIVDRRMALDTNEKERLRRTMRQVEAFSGVQVLTYAILDNHFHILLHVPRRREVTDEEFVQRLGHIYDSTIVENLERELKSRREHGQNEAAESLKAEYTYRMYDISEFMKTFKQRFTQSYNLRHGRKGTLWEERFKSILLQGRSGHALATIAAYIDLNAVRAGIVADPKDYRFSGYGEAMAGSNMARSGLMEVMLSLGIEAGWRAVSGRYREFLYVAGRARGVDKQGRTLRCGFDPKQVEEVLNAGGEVALPELLRCRVRYFTDGVILGSRAYVDDMFLRYRSRFSMKRETGARPIRGGCPGLFTLRRLRLATITVPVTS